MSDLADIGVIGLGVMGAALARNLRSRGLKVAVWNLEAETADRFMAAHGDSGYARAHNLAEFVQFLQPPRAMLLMVTAGRAVDAVLENLAPHLQLGDTVVDGGNSLYTDTQRRDVWCRDHGFSFVGMGVSGGEQGALLGPAMMPGGDPASWTRVGPLLERACAVSESGPCIAWCGGGGAGHFVKMVHNGIEYGDMQLIAEAWSLLRAAGRRPTEMAELFGRWNEGVLKSYLIEITAQIVDRRDPQGDGPLLDQIADVAGQKGTGRWTAVEALQLGVPIPTITAAVETRGLSGDSARATLSQAYGPRPLQPPSIDDADLEQALLACKLASYSQGFQLLAAASRSYGFGTDLGSVARIWTAGCIIRAGLLDAIRRAFDRDPALPVLVLDPEIGALWANALPGLRRAVAQAALAGVPVPALSASLAWADGLCTAHGSAALLQAQRDWFGAHTYRRRDQPDQAIHSDWAVLERVAD